MLTNSALKGYSDYTQRVINRATYRVGSTDHDAKIDRVVQEADNSISVYLVIDHEAGGDVIIQDVRIYDTGGNLWFRQDESIALSAYQEGVLYKFSFEFVSKEV